MAHDPEGFALISCEAVQRSTGIFTAQLKSETGRQLRGGGLIMRLAGPAA